MGRSVYFQNANMMNKKRSLQNENREEYIFQMNIAKIAREQKWVRCMWGMCNEVYFQNANMMNKRRSLQKGNKWGEF